MELVGDGMRNTLSYKAADNVRREVVGNTTTATNKPWPSKENKPNLIREIR